MRLFVSPGILPIDGIEHNFVSASVEKHPVARVVHFLGDGVQRGEKQSQDFFKIIHHRRKFSA
jgi:hypothetical protein